MTLSFYVAWLPYATTALLTMSGVLIPYGWNIVSVLFAKSATISNPIMYIFLNKIVSNFYADYANDLHNVLLNLIQRYRIILINIDAVITSFNIMLFSRSKRRINNSGDIQISRIEN